MTFACTKVTAYGIEASEPLQKRFRQVWIIEGTAANTNVSYDFGTYAGTFWTAVGATDPGETALKALQDINIAAKTYTGWGGLGLNAYARADGAIPQVLSYLSAATASGSATQTLAVTGLLATDTILSVTPEIASVTGRPSITTLAGTVAAGSATPTATVAGLATSATDTILAVTQDAVGANNLPLLGYDTQAAGSLRCVYSADPGANGTIKVAISRVATTDAYNPVSWANQADNSLDVVYGANPGTGAKVLVSVLRAGVTTVQSGTYQMSMDGTNTNLPNFLFLSGDAPTSFKIQLEWVLKDGINPIEVYAAA